MFIAIYFKEKEWLGNVLQAIGTISGIYLTIIIFLQSNEESDKQFRKQFRKQLEHLQILNSKQIDALQSSTEKQIKTFQDLNSKQILALQELNAKQIDALHYETERQIKTIQESTNEQIYSFEQQINYVTNKLKDNSILLAEILSRELEKSLEYYSSILSREEAKYNDLADWKLLRTKEERERQLNQQWNRLEQIKNGYNYLIVKYKNLKQFLGIEQKKLK
ncbi:MAG: hypothetical protein A2033_12825 [Bacteroidetes bacterium GWA2_31_9]|nr:MAG: hypothetical protein A2033_12825 [Bacteroidetes bacterium GWA2_31_9]